MQQAVTPACAKTVTQDPIVKLTLTSVLPLHATMVSYQDCDPNVIFRCNQNLSVGYLFLTIKKLRIGDCSNLISFVERWTLQIKMGECNKERERDEPETDTGEITNKYERQTRVT